MAHKAPILSKQWFKEAYDYSDASFAHLIHSGQFYLLLVSIGYTRQQRTFTPKQAIAIYNHIGPMVDSDKENQFIQLFGKHLDNTTPFISATPVQLSLSLSNTQQP